MEKKKTKLRIHGDNILECESALKFLASALNRGDFKLKSGPAYAPVYTLAPNRGEVFDIQLFAGYGRWVFPLAEYVTSLGGTLRESPDAVVTRVEKVGDDEYERPALALEFSGALPAGNNAWQRTGRALALAHAGIPYLYFAEIGGQELGPARRIKAARFPNPLVPFAHAVLGASSGTTSLPIYAPSPSSNELTIEIFDECFGVVESIELTREILLSEDTKQSEEILEQKALKIVEVLSKQRKRNDVLEAKEWAELFSMESGVAKAKWLTEKAMPWNKKTGIKTLTSTFKELIDIAKKCGAVAIGAKEMPLCLIPAEKRELFAKKIKSNYKRKVSDEFINWVSVGSYPLICVWAAGFKPRGDDSRPDRGLVPLARMIFGMKDIDLLTVVYGPALISTWEALEADMHRLASTNGLWEAIVNLSDGIIVDSSTSKKLTSIGFIVNKMEQSLKQTLLPAASENPVFGEHDIDSVLHLLFSHSSAKGRAYECMCNPPGGDWSGINILEPKEKIELRWTSLPRVSGTDSKRPDHLVQLLGGRTLLSVESKDTASRLEAGIGPRLVGYAKVLLESAPIAVRPFGTDTWERYKGQKVKKFELLSGGAFRYAGEENLKSALARATVDIVFGIEFHPQDKEVIVHLFANEAGEKYIKRIKKLASDLDGLIDVKVHQ